MTQEEQQQVQKWMKNFDDENYIKTMDIIDQAKLGLIFAEMSEKLKPLAIKYMERDARLGTEASTFLWKAEKKITETEAGKCRLTLKRL